MRLGILGGTFDPPHVGHLLAATDAYEMLELDRLIFVPANRQPLKSEASLTPPAIRMRLLEAMIGDDPRFGVDPVEIERTGLSFTVDTLEEFARRYPAAERYFLLGLDAFATLAGWREPQRVASLARLAVLERALEPAGVAEREAEEASAVVRRIWERVGGESAPAPVVLASRRIDVSSSEIRERVRGEKPIRGFVTEAVARLIEAHGLYR